MAAGRSSPVCASMAAWLELSRVCLGGGAELVHARLHGGGARAHPRLPQRRGEFSAGGGGSQRRRAQGRRPAKTSASGGWEGGEASTGAAASRGEDLSFNKLSGEIPASFANMGGVDYMDISVNNFTLGSSGPRQCVQGSINLVESYSPEMTSLNSVQPCLKRNFPCVASNGKYQSSLHINCGDKEVTINGYKYEADMIPKGASELYVSPGSNWALSSTGNFMDNNINDDNYIAATASNLTMPNWELYAKARLSPLSLAYYGLCMFNGSYTVKLHFAEIVFTNDNTYSSLGKRRFNVFIQNHTLEVQFYWAGRGTTGIPARGFYGPLISAISVTPNFQIPLAVEPPQTSSSKKTPRSPISKAFMIGIPIIAIFTALIVGVCWIKQWRKSSMPKELRALDLQIGSFTLRQIKAATRNFDAANKIGEGGFGSVYKGSLSDGTVIAVKQLSSSGYMAPEYAMRGYLTEKADVYSFGVVALEIVSGKSNTNYRPKEDFVYLLDWACVLHERGTLLELVDPDLGSNYSREEALLMLNVALLCTTAAPTLRPKMSKVVSLLEGNTPLQPLLSDLALAANSLSSSGLRRNFWQNLSEDQSLIVSSNKTNESSSVDNDG
ncbi:hypothetical protein PR202_ga16072 [Eleusine coracana subsp. coracana]|uniref:non-specific serine/threonine protein kinase n=1 Tax=Eleusine coracana subsp. coracana TaxID=191504 RepID=A0AAV5CLM1_ELECO|nr:hypothetical protein PR202_ga16072 [Eleusine coracana subsp. coracana]